MKFKVLSFFVGSTAAGKGRLYGLCVWLSAVVVLCACGAAASLAVWLLGLWPDTTPRPELFASSAAAMVVQWSIFLVDGRRRLGGDVDRA